MEATSTSTTACHSPARWERPAVRSGRAAPSCWLPGELPPGRCGPSSTRLGTGSLMQPGWRCVGDRRDGDGCRSTRSGRVWLKPTLPSVRIGAANMRSTRPRSRERPAERARGSGQTRGVATTCLRRRYRAPRSGDRGRHEVDAPMGQVREATAGIGRKLKFTPAQTGTFI